MCIESLYASEFKTICYKICNQSEKHLSSDLFQETVLKIIELGVNVCNINSDELPFFFSKCAWNTYHSAQFCKTFRKKQYKPIHVVEFKENMVLKDDQYTKDKDNGIEVLEMELFQITQSVEEEYKRTLFNCYLRYGSGYAVSTLTGIPVRTVYQDLKDYKEELKKKYNEAINKD